MKRILLLILILFCASSRAESLLTPENLAPIYDFAREYSVEGQTRMVLENAMRGELPEADSIKAFVANHLKDAFHGNLSAVSEIIAPVLLLMLLRAVLPDGNAAGLLLRVVILRGFFQIAQGSFLQVQECLKMSAGFSEKVSPVLTALLAAIGLEGTAALVSPAAALAGNAADELFLRVGLPLCRISLCTSIAGNLSPVVDLNRFTNLFKRIVTWISALAITLFTALLALQGGVSEGVDSIGVRTAKFAVDSAAPVIGSGVSDAWESYVSGVLIAKNAVGVSGIVVLLLVGAEPVIVCASAMLVLHFAAALLDVFGEKETARAGAQIAGVCQMALSLCTASLAIGTILFAAVMSVGRNLL